MNELVDVNCVYGMTDFMWCVWNDKWWCNVHVDLWQMSTLAGLGKCLHWLDLSVKNAC